MDPSEEETKLMAPQSNTTFYIKRETFQKHALHRRK